VGFLLSILIASTNCFAIGNGVKTNKYPGIVYLEIGFDEHCTGTIVGPNTVLTAGHCLETTARNHPYLSIVLDDGTRVKATHTLIFPKFSSIKVDHDQQPLPGFNDYDVGLIQFDHQVSPEIIIPIQEGKSAEQMLHRQVQVYGYGKNDDSAQFFDGLGTKRTTTNQLRFYFAPYFYSLGFIHNQSRSWAGFSKPTGQNGSTLPGDSGGPTILGGSVVAITSSAYDNATDSDYETERNYLLELSKTDLKQSSSILGVIPQLQENQTQIDKSVSVSDLNVQRFFREAAQKGYRINFTQ